MLKADGETKIDKRTRCLSSKGKGRKDKTAPSKGDFSLYLEVKRSMARAVASLKGPIQVMGSCLCQDNPHFNF